MPSRKAAPAALAAALLLAGTACADGGMVAQSSCSVLDTEGGHLVTCYAEVVNVSGDVICLEEGTYDLLSGDEVLAAGQVQPIMPYFLAPGERGYLCDAALVENETMPPITALRYDVEYLTIDGRYAPTALLCTPERMEREDGGLTVELLLRNETDETAWSPAVSYGLYSGSGALLYADGRTLDGTGIPPGGSLRVRFTVLGALLERWDGFGAPPEEIHASACFGGDED